MSLMQNTSEINKTDKQVYLITLLRKSTNMPQYIDHMIYDVYNRPCGQYLFLE